MWRTWERKVVAYFSVLPSQSSGGTDLNYRPFIQDKWCPNLDSYGVCLKGIEVIAQVTCSVTFIFTGMVWDCLSDFKQNYHIIPGFLTCKIISTCEINKKAHFWQYIIFKLTQKDLIPKETNIRPLITSSFSSKTKKFTQCVTHITRIKRLGIE
jgi:hypothetical protein